MPLGPLIECGLAETYRKPVSHSSPNSTISPVDACAITVVNICVYVFVSGWGGDVVVQRCEGEARGKATLSDQSHVGVAGRNTEYVSSQT